MALARGVYTATEQRCANVLARVTESRCPRRRWYREEAGAEDSTRGVARLPWANRTAPIGGRERRLRGRCGFRRVSAAPRLGRMLELFHRETEGAAARSRTSQALGGRFARIVRTT